MSSPVKQDKMLLHKQFHDAVADGNIAMVIEHLSNGVNIDCKNINGESALHVAIEKSYYKLAKLLIEEYGADVNAIDDMDFSLVVTACSNDDLKILALLISNGANIGYTNMYGETALHFCATDNSTVTCKFLLEKRIDVNAKEFNLDKTPLHYAIDASHLDIVRLLCNRKDLNVNAVDAMGRTGLFLACSKNGNIEIVKFLMERPGCDINLKDFDNNSPLDEARKCKSHDIVAALLAKQQQQQQQQLQNDGYKLCNTLHVHACSK